MKREIDGRDEPKGRDMMAKLAKKGEGKMAKLGGKRTRDMGKRDKNKVTREREGQKEGIKR